VFTLTLKALAVPISKKTFPVHWNYLDGTKAWGPSTTANTLTYVTSPSAVPDLFHGKTSAFRRPKIVPNPVSKPRSASRHSRQQHPQNYGAGLTALFQIIDNPHLIFVAPHCDVRAAFRFRVRPDGALRVKLVTEYSIRASNSTWEGALSNRKPGHATGRVNFISKGLLG
jgi:hypothetical protein